MDLLIFDLDGTLIDSKLDLAHSVNATREFLGLGPIEHDRVYSYVGNGAPVLIRKSLGPEASDEDIERGLAYFIRYYHDHRLDHTTLYPGVRTTLESLHARGVQLSVLTNKPVRISQMILEGLGVGPLFFQVYGGNSFEQKKPHPVGVEKLLGEAGATRDETMMVGDSAVDIRTARNAGIRSCGVSYGFQPESLVDDPPDVMIDRFAQLVEVLGR